MKRITPILLASLLSAFAAVMIYDRFHTPERVVIRETLPVTYVNDSPDIPAAPIMPMGERIASTPENFVSAANNAREAVVSIQARAAGSFWRNDVFNSSSGSGVILSDDGYIATNKHVIEEGVEIVVTLNDQREYTAEVVGKDAATDLALLKIDAEDLTSVPFGNSDSLYVGEWVLAIGNPFRLRSTVTAGIVSAKGRNISILPEMTGIESFIQTDAAVNPGNSGGALVNTNGELVGINTAIITYSGQYEGFSFAVPSNLARKVLRDLRVYGSVQRGWLGVVIRSVDNELANDLELPKVSGVYIDNVNPYSAANDAGLRRGDVIIAVNDVDIQGSPQFMEQVGQLGPGDKLKVEFIRNGRKQRTDVTLSSRQDAVSYVLRDEDMQNIEDVEDIEQMLLEDLGMVVRELNDRELSRLSKDGVVVESIVEDSKIARTNMKDDYIITSVNGVGITSKNELIRELAKADDLVVVEGYYENYPGEYPYAFHKD